MEPDLDFRSSDGTLAVTLPSSRLDEMLAHCRAAGDAETGGILIGRYTERLDRAVVTEITGPPGDSRATRTGFRRGVRGLRALVSTVWRERGEFYLGEWHFHPGASASPSDVDRAQMRAFAANSLHQCPEPILVVIGGDPETEWDLSASVTRDEELIALGLAFRVPDIGQQ